MSAIILAVDFGGTNVRVAAVDAEGGILGLERTPTPADAGPHAVIEVIVAALRSTAAQLGASPAAIGLAAPGPVDARRGVVLDAPNLTGWHDVALAKRIAEAVEIPAYVHNDANLAALGEARLGAGRDCDPLVYLTVSTGVGGGIIHHGRIFEGAHGLAGEFGHVIVQVGGRRSRAGHAGSLEALASGTAIAGRARELLDAGGSSMLGRETAALDAAAVARAAGSGDELARQVYREAGEALGLAIGGFANILDPARFVIGGGVSSAWELWAEHAEAAARTVIMAPHARRLEIVPAAFPDRAGLLGAAIYARECAKPRR